MNIEFTTNPTSSDIDFLTKGIMEESATQFASAHSFAFYIRDEKENIIAGCNGYVYCGHIYTDQLWVDKNYQKAGLGKQLIEAVHDYGKKAGCIVATLGTMNFQNALGFYKKLGYEIEFERKGYANNASCLCLKKNL
jgi:ribosomal protein S18 acetylase RimI-like enzyme